MAKPASLAAQTGTVAGPSLQLPAVFSAPTEKIEAKFFGPYVTFAHPKRADEWSKLTGKFGQISEAEMYLFTKEDILHLDPLKCSLLTYKQYWVHTNAAGTEIIAASWQEMPKPYKEHVEAAIVVYTPNGLVPANICFRTTKCGGVRVLADALLEAQTPVWGEKSPAHKESMVISQPSFRFYGELRLGAPRTGKGSGMPYRPLLCNIKPTGATEWRQLDELSKSPNFGELMNMVATRFESRIEDIAKKIS